MRRALTRLALLAYLCAVVGVTMFPLTPNTPEFWGDAPWWTLIHYRPFHVDTPSFVLNIVMFAPFGVLLPLVRSRADSLLGVARWAFGVSCLIEATQLVLDVTVGGHRTVDINDLMANVVGAECGLVVLRFLLPDPLHRALLSYERAEMRPWR